MGGECLVFEYIGGWNAEDPENDLLKLPEVIPSPPPDEEEDVMDNEVVDAVDAFTATHVKSLI